MRLLIVYLIIPYLCVSQNLLETRIHDEITIEEIQESFKNNDYTIVELTDYYLSRIESLNLKGPKLNAVITINPDAIKIATELETERQQGKLRGPLHGIPILLKDNINTFDKMPCTAGSRVMRNSYPLRDSPLVIQLRKSGAIIIGKANLSEWANFHSYGSSSGWSGLQGQTKNPYKLDCNPCGSSAGSAVGVSANMSVLAIGTETNGSIVCPSNNNGIVGIKPTVGLISRTGIIPISETHDTAGPMARSVRDAVICLGALTSIDPLDKKTLQANRKIHSDYTPYLKLDGLKGKTIGYYSHPVKEDQRLVPIMEEAIKYFKENGAEIIELDNFITKDVYQASFTVMLYEFNNGINKYLNNLGENSVVKNLSEIIDLTLNDSIEMANNKHEILELALTKGSLKSKEYLDGLKLIEELKETFKGLMDSLELDAIISPTGSPAWKTDIVNGDDFGASSSSLSAITGNPNITLPMGQVEGLPVGLSIFGRAWSEPVLIEIAYAFEQGTKKRRTPFFLEK